MKWYDEFTRHQGARFAASDRFLVSVVADAVFSIYWPMTADAYGTVR